MTAVYNPDIELPYNDPAKSRKVVIVTGSNIGIGYYTALHLYMHGWYVYMACRSESKAKDAQKRILEEAKERKAKDPSLKDAIFGELDFLKLDLGSLKQTEEAAEIFKRKEPNGLDILINNAGVMALPVQMTEDGYDIQLQVNHLAPSLFTLKLLPLLLANKGATGRIVNLSSLGHQGTDGACDYTRLYDWFPVSFWSFMRYGLAKNANIHMAKALAQRYPSKLLCTSVHPGVCVDTGLGRYWDDKLITGLLMKTTFALSSVLGGITGEQGSYTSLYCALSPELTAEKDNGKFYRPWPHAAEPSNTAKDPVKIEKTWLWTVNELVKKGYLDTNEVDSFRED